MLTHVCLQEELDAYDTRQMELEDEMDKKVLTLLALLVQKYLLYRYDSTNTDS